MRKVTHPTSKISTLTQTPTLAPSKEQNRVKFSRCDSDKIIKEHAIHWLVCIETYELNRRKTIHEWTLFYEDPETCIYINTDTVIIGFRGTNAIKDLYDDTLISIGTVFPRATKAVQYTVELKQLNPWLSVELTGHSLGGAVARETSKKLHLKTITFNSAAPPSYPATNAQDEVAYHIVFDIISAWQSPNTIRIDKGYWPVSSPWGGAYLWVYYTFRGVRDAHTLTNFSNQRPGRVISSQHENCYLRTWFRSLPIAGRAYTLLFLSGSNGTILFSLPELKP